MTPDQPPVRLQNPSRDDLNRCIALHRPAILCGLMADQFATRAWDLPYLRELLGPKTVLVTEQAAPRLYWDPARGIPLRAQTFDEFADQVFGATAPDPAVAGYHYLQDDVNSFPVIGDDYRLPPMIAEKQIVRGKLWLSGAGLITPLHYDSVESVHWVIRGSKRFLCYAPGVRSFYPFSWRTTAPHISQVDPDRPDLARHPRFARAQPMDFEVHAGEVLYLPAFWWHQVYSLAALNLSLNFVWFASLARNARHLPQFALAGRHLAIQVRKARVKARAAEASRAAH